MAVAGTEANKTPAITAYVLAVYACSALKEGGLGLITEACNEMPPEDAIVAYRTLVNHSPDQKGFYALQELHARKARYDEQSKEGLAYSLGKHIGVYEAGGLIDILSATNILLSIEDEAHRAQAMAGAFRGVRTGVITLMRDYDKTAVPNRIPTAEDLCAVERITKLTERSAQYARLSAALMEPPVRMKDIFGRCKSFCTRAWASFTRAQEGFSKAISGEIK